MMIKPKRPCNAPGCPALVEKGYCEAHQASNWDYEKWRGSSSERGYDYKWQKFRDAYLRREQNIMCRQCLIKLATDVHHIKPLDLNPSLKYADSNLKPLCHECHSSITASGRT